MIEIRIEAKPNQTLTFQDEDRYFKITLRSTLDRITADVFLNNEPLILGCVVAEGSRIIPYRYLAPDFNFYLMTYNDEQPDWSKFGSTQKLYYERKI